MKRGLTGYARVIVGDDKDNSHIIDLQRHGENKWTLKLTHTYNGAEVVSKYQIGLMKKVKLVDEAIERASKLIKKALLKENDN